MLESSKKKDNSSLERLSVKRLGLGFLNHPFGIRDVMDYAVTAEEGGFESVWMADESFLRDIVPYLTAMALSTSKIKLGTGVVNPFSRTSISIAQTITTLDELSQGRMILGLGAGGRTIEGIGMKFENPLMRVKESVQVVRGLIAKSEVTFDGVTQNYNKVSLGRASPSWSAFGRFVPFRKSVPIYLAAIGPKMIQLAGEVGDGVLLSAGVPVDGLNFVYDNVAIGLKRRKKKSYQHFDVAAYVPTCINPDKKEKSIIKKIVADFISSRAGSSYFGAETENHKFSESDLSDKMLHQCAAFGEKSECVETIESFRMAGVKLPIIFPIGRRVKEILSLFSQDV